MNKINSCLKMSSILVNSNAFFNNRLSNLVNSSGTGAFTAAKKQHTVNHAEQFNKTHHQETKQAPQQGTPTRICKPVHQRSCDNNDPHMLMFSPLTVPVLVPINRFFLYEPQFFQQFVPVQQPQQQQQPQPQPQQLTQPLIQKQVPQQVQKQQVRSIQTSAPRRGNIFNVQDEDDFQARVIDSKRVVIVDFHATWCGPCKILGPRLEKIMANETKADFAKVDIDQLQDLAFKYDITSVPTVMAFKNGKPIYQFMGVKEDDQLRKFIKDAIEK